MSSFEKLKNININDVFINVSYVGFRVDLRDVLGAISLDDVSQEEFEEILSKYIDKLKPHCSAHIESK